jgi:MFS family permease
VLVRLADEGARVGLALLAVERGAGTAAGGALVAALLVPHVVAAPLAGLLVDRARRPRLVVAGAGLLLSVALAVTVLTVGGAPLVVVLLVLVVAACGGPALSGGLTSQLPALVERQALPRAFGLDGLTYNLAGVAGPAVTAVVAGATSAATAVCVLSACATAGALVIAVLPGAPRPSVEQADEAPGPLAGISLVLADRDLRAVTAATVAGQVGLGALPVVAVVLATHVHHPADAGWLLTACTAGGLLGSLAWTARPAPSGRARTVVMAGLVAVGAPVVLASAVASSTAAVGLLLAVSGAFNGPVFGALLLVRQDRAPEAARSQVFAVGAGAKLTASAAGAAVAGLAGGLPVPALLLLAGGLPVVSGGVGLALGRGRSIAQASAVPDRGTCHGPAPRQPRRRPARGR